MLHFLNMLSYIMLNMLHHVSRYSRCPTLQGACAMLPLVFVSLVDLRLVSGAQMSEYIQYHMRVGGVFDILGQELCLMKCYAQSHGQWCAQSSCELHSGRNSKPLRRWCSIEGWNRPKVSNLQRRGH